MPFNFPVYESSSNINLSSATQMVSGRYHPTNTLKTPSASPSNPSPPSNAAPNFLTPLPSEPYSPTPSSKPTPPCSSSAPPLPPSTAATSPAPLSSHLPSRTPRPVTTQRNVSLRVPNAWLRLARDAVTGIMMRVLFVSRMRRCWRRGGSRRVRGGGNVRDVRWWLRGMGGVCI